jgi:hypothetical protein
LVGRTAKTYADSCKRKQVLFITITLLQREDRTIKSCEPSKQDTAVQDIQIQEQDVDLSCSLVITLQERD